MKTCLHSRKWRPPAKQDTTKSLASKSKRIKTLLYWNSSLTASHRFTPEPKLLTSSAEEHKDLCFPQGRIRVTSSFPQPECWREAQEFPFWVPQAFPECEKETMWEKVAAMALKVCVQNKLSAQARLRMKYLIKNTSEISKFLLPTEEVQEVT